MGFAKLDEGIIKSSIMQEDSDTFKVWIVLVASCGADGIARVSSVFLEAVCRLPIKTVDAALRKLEAPDPRSRSKEDAGRRIRSVDGGYFVTNYQKYRAFDYSIKKEAVRKRAYRERLKEDGTQGTLCPVVPFVPGHSASASADASVSGYLLRKERTKIIEEAVVYLNEKTGKHFRPGSTETVRLLNGRLDEGRTLDEIKRVVDVKVAKWKGETWTDKQTGEVVQADDYLRPSTLFRPTNFENYVNEIIPGRKKRADADLPPDDVFRKAYEKRKAQEAQS